MSSRKGLTFACASILASTMLGAFSAAATAGNVNAVYDNKATALTTSPKRLQPEPAVAIDPANPHIIAAGAQDFRKTTELNLACVGNRWNGLYISYNSGNTWEQSLVPGYFTDPTSPQGTEQAVSEQFGLCLNTDPVIVFDGLGNMYYSHISFDDVPEGQTTPTTVGAIYASTYRLGSDGKYAHAKTVRVPAASGLSMAGEIHEVGPGSSNFDDKQWMTVDRSPGSPHYGRVYVTWTKFNAQGGQSSLWLSHCGGDVPGQACADDSGGWSDGVLINKPVAGGLVQESFPATAPDGTIYVGFLQFQGGFGSTLPHAGIWIAKSTDGGATFTQRRITPIRQIPSPIPPQGSAANDGNNSFRTGTVPGVAITPNDQSPAGYSVHVAWGEWIGEQQADVRYSRSTDGGATWATPLTLNDVATGHQFFPSIAASGKNVHVAWLDGRLNPAGQTITKLQVAYTTFADGGAGAATDTIVTDKPFNPNQVSRFPVFCQAFIGDYIDIDVVPDGAGVEVAIIWSDNRNVGTPLSPTECAALRLAPALGANQPRLNDGSLDQDAFVEILP